MQVFVDKHLYLLLNMYGLLLEGICYYIKSVFGEEILNEIMLIGNFKHLNFETHKVKVL